jgi:NADPH:quinone reductase
MMNYLVEPEETTFYGSQLYELIANGTINIRIHKEYPFTAEGVRDGQTDLVGGKSSGKLVVKVANE